MLRLMGFVEQIQDSQNKACVDKTNSGFLEQKQGWQNKLGFLEQSQVWKNKFKIDKAMVKLID